MKKSKFTDSQVISTLKQGESGPPTPDLSREHGLTAQAFVKDPALDSFAGKVSDSGEGRWTIAAANDLGVPAHVLTAALYERFASRDRDVFQNKVLSAMRLGFGGHMEKS